ncbi:MAG: hypothetical protein ACOX50_00155 [Patescibacteria group bacterium]|jgi:chromosome segregation ATPase
MLTKNDLQQIQKLLTGTVSPLKQDLSGLKQDVGVLKQDVGGLKQDVGVLKQGMVKAEKRMERISGVVGELVQKFEDVKEDVKEIKDKIHLLPSKEEYFAAMDKLMGELKNKRESQEIIGYQLASHEDRLKKLESKASSSFV